jgi:hypothetical protein
MAIYYDGANGNEYLHLTGLMIRIAIYNGPNYKEYLYVTGLMVRNSYL